MPTETPTTEWELFREKYDIKPQESDEENDIQVADLRSIKNSIWSREIYLARNQNIKAELKRIQTPDSLPHSRIELNPQHLLVGDARIGASVGQNAVKPETVNSHPKETVVNNNIPKYMTENKANKVQVPNVNALTYELEHFPQNAMIIFNHEHFRDSETRTGTDRDVTALTDTFKQFRFDVRTHNDLKRKPLLEELQRFGKQNFEDCGCICVAILTHGSDHGYLRAADVRYSERDLFACFDTRTNQTLVAKPIIFLIQACRGNHLASAVRVIVGQSEGGYPIELDAERNPSGCFLPTEADMIIFHSCFYGRASARVANEGTWFIQTICQQLNLHASTEHLEEIFRRVRKTIALEKGSEHAKQMPITSTTLLRKLYLLPKRDFGDQSCVKPANNVIETRSFDANLDSTQNGHALLGVAFTIVYCCLLYSSVVREHIYFFTALVFAYMGHFGVSWSKILATLVLFSCFYK